MNARLPSVIRARTWPLARAGLAASMVLLAAASRCIAAPAAGDPGARIASAGTPAGAPACASCHGARGEGLAMFPHLAGTGAAYLHEQLDAFAAGTRQNPIMQPIAQALTAQDRAAVAAFYAALPAPVHASDRGAASAADAGAWLATRGRWADDLPACAQCHGPGGAGVGSSIPPLAGQPAAYLAQQLQAWQAGSRPPGPQGLMQGVARRLKDADVQAVSSYYAGLGTAAPTAGAASAPPVPAPASASTAATPVAAASAPAFQPPAEDSIPDNAYGKMIRLGEQVFNDTGRYASAYVGNDLNCVNCHLDAGRKPDSAPMWAAFVHYPAFRAKTGQVDTLASRLQGCFQFSMNGKAPPQDDVVITALQTYAAFLAKGAPVGLPLAGSGYPQLKAPAQAPDYGRGQQVYAQNCALCHGAEGQGQRAGDRQVFPPLWGARSFNWGAGMHQVNNAAAFIHANMPLGLGRSLTEQQAWDVAYFMDAHERPQDPRFKGSVAETRKRHHDTPQSLYGTVVNGHLLGSEPAKGARTAPASR